MKRPGRAADSASGAAVAALTLSGIQVPFAKRWRGPGTCRGPRGRSGRLRLRSKLLALRGRIDDWREPAPEHAHSVERHILLVRLHVRILHHFLPGGVAGRLVRPLDPGKDHL